MKRRPAKEQKARQLWRRAPKESVSMTEYDDELGKITDQDRSCAKELADDLRMVEVVDEELVIIAEWFRKVRYEAVVADRKDRSR